MIINYGTQEQIIESMRKAYLILRTSLEIQGEKSMGENAKPLFIINDTQSVMTGYKFDKNSRAVKNQENQCLRRQL